MKKVQLGTHTVQLYDDIADLPIRRFHKFNKLLLIDAGIGSDIADFDAHIEKVVRYIQSGDKDAAGQELMNMRQNLYAVQTELSPKFSAFACLIASIDGKPCDDISDDALQCTLNRIGDVSVKDLTTLFGVVKKKIDEDLQTYFPHSFDDAATKEYYDQLKRRTILILQDIVEGEANLKTKQEIERLTNELITYIKPKCYEGKDSVEIKYDKQFENMCLVLSKHLHVDPKKYTVLEFFNAYEYMEDEVKRQKTAVKA